METANWNISWFETDSASCFDNYVQNMDEVPSAFCNPIDTLNDSLLIHQVKLSEIQYGKGFLEIKSEKQEPIIRKPSESANWIFFILLFSLLLLGLKLAFSFSRYNQAIKSAFSFRESGIFMRNYSTANISISTLTTYVITYSLLALIIIKYIDINYKINERFINFIWLFIGLISYQLFKTIIISVSGQIFESKAEAEIYIFRDYFSKIIGSTIALPIVFATFFSPFQEIFLFIAAIILLYTFAHQYVLAIITGYSNSSYNFMYFILYFCTVEILPLLIGAKILINSNLIA